MPVLFTYLYSALFLLQTFCNTHVNYESMWISDRHKSVYHKTQKSASNVYYTTVNKTGNLNLKTLSNFVN